MGQPLPLPLTPKQALAIIEGLGTPSKMPGYSWSISARKCKKGNKLREINNSVCASCYAFRGNYNFPVVVNAMERRLQAMKNPQWVEAMVVAINYYSRESGYFRFFDSGDLQDTKMFADICEIARQCPSIQFWLPTKEYGFVTDHLDSGGTIPSNLNVRLSAYIVDGPAPTALAKRLNLTTSTVTRDADKVTCPSNKQGNKCLDCRKCWDKNVSNITYHKH